MIITLPRNSMPDNPSQAICDIADKISRDHYPLSDLAAPGEPVIGNMYVAVTWAKGRRVSFTIRTRDSYKHGSRTSASGRHMPKASWEAHRDVMRALFDVWPEASLRTALATYVGKEGFERDFPATANHNVGSNYQPRRIIDCSI